jgi:hypothetical protein
MQAKNSDPAPDAAPASDSELSIAPVTVSGNKVFPAEGVVKPSR